MSAHPEDIIGFWQSAGPARWWAKSAAFDDAVRLKYEATHHAAARGAYASWEGSPDGALGLLILLDQFPRNLYRGSAHAFATDPLARRIARKAVAAGFDESFEPPMRGFFYLPFEHSEDLADQKLAVELFAACGDELGLRWARVHLDIIQRFGRFPHRNPALGRETTAEEQVFLDEGGFAG